MDPGDDIIDVLYRYSLQSRPHHDLQEQQPQALQRQRSDSGRCPASAGYDAGVVCEGRGRFLQHDRESSFELVPNSSAQDNAPMFEPNLDDEIDILDDENISRRSVRKDVIYPDEEDPAILRKKLRLDLVQLSNGVRIKKAPAKRRTAHAQSQGTDGPNLDSELSRNRFALENDTYCTINSLPGHQRTRNPQLLARQEPVYVSSSSQTDKNSFLLTSTDHKSQQWTILYFANFFMGAAVMLYLAFKWSYFLSQIHDNLYWFTNIKQVEREISFRTEQGLYYSYYKQLTAAPSLSQGIEDLKQDKVTEHPDTINIFYRFNIHQELILATLYKYVAPSGMAPIFFYINFVFGLQGFFLCSMFLITWFLSGTWVAGILMTGFLISNRHDITRVSFTISLREHFALPFIFAQFAVVGRYLGLKSQELERIHLVLIYFFSLVFALFWQFSQFVLLLQALCLFALGITNLADRDKVCKVFAVNLLAIVTVWYLQFYQPMIINSLIVSVIPIAVFILQSSETAKGLGIFKNITRVFLQVFSLLAISIILNSAIKVILGQDADNHIFRFVKSKFGYEDQTDFETRLYLCLSIFRPLSWDYYENLAKTGNLPVYSFITLVELIGIALTLFKIWMSKEKQEDKSDQNQNALQIFLDWIESKDDLKWILEKWKNPELCYHLAQSIILGILAMSTLRMKCFWGPYICVISAFGVSHFNLWNFFTSKFAGTANNKLLTNFIRHIVIGSAILAVYLSNNQSVRDELENLQEFYDPDTVQLMEWISHEVPKDSSISGSMQLMAGVKLCTGRPIVNHPHFEDQHLRTKTKELYQFYARTPPEEVHEILTRYKTNYIILEDSICLSRSEDRCNLPSTMDLANGHIPDDGVKDPPSLVPSPHPRFCHQIRFGEPQYTNLFKLVFENRTFRIFEVLNPKL